MTKPKITLPCLQAYSGTYYTTRNRSQTDQRNKNRRKPHRPKRDPSFAIHWLDHAAADRVIALADPQMQASSLTNGKTFGAGSKVLPIFAEQMLANLIWFSPFTCALESWAAAAYGTHDQRFPLVRSPHSGSCEALGKLYQLLLLIYASNSLGNIRSQRRPQGCLKNLPLRKARRAPSGLPRENNRTPLEMPSGSLRKAVGLPQEGRRTPSGRS
jgi:hypothetical protein